MEYRAVDGKPIKAEQYAKGDNVKQRKTDFGKDGAIGSSNRKGPGEGGYKQRWEITRTVEAADNEPTYKEEYREQKDRRNDAESDGRKPARRAQAVVGFHHLTRPKISGCANEN